MRPRRRTPELVLMPDHPDVPQNAQAAPASARPLLFFTSLSALDGTIAMLAAAGTLSHLAGAISAGLTVIAGAGAWITAREAFHGRLRPRDWRRLGLIALATSTLALLATAAGTWAASLLEPVWLPKAAGVATIMAGAEVARIPIPRIPGIPLPIAFVVVLAGAVLEVVHHWIP